MNKLGWSLIGIGVTGALAAGWMLEGRYLVEGGRAPWAVINARHDVLAQALSAGVSDEEKQDALSRAVQRKDFAALEMLLAAGASPNPATKGYCHVASALRFGQAKVASMLLEAGADPALCDVDVPTMAKDLLTYGHDNDPEPDILWTMSLLVAADPDAGAANRWSTAIADARKFELSEVAAFLENPSARAPTRPDAPAADRPQGKPGSLDLDDLKTVCTGAALEDAAPYVAQAGQAAQVYYFERRSDEFRWPGRGPGMPSLPRWWTSWDDPSHTQLVACVDVVNKTKVRTCDYEGEGGGITMYDATFTVKLHEAKTGKEVDSTTFEKSIGRDCPQVKSGSDQEGLFPPYSDELKEFLVPHVEPAAARARVD
jgi:hypothetical protein